MLNHNLLLADDGYNIQRSLRFRSSASAYLNRTPASAGSQTTWTYSKWVKRGSLGSVQRLFNSVWGTTDDNLRFTASDTIDFYIDNVSGGRLITNAVYRDPSAWYHLVFVWDSTNATSSDRLRLYVNGVRVTSFSTASYPTQNYAATGINSAHAHAIARYVASSAEYFDGYLTDINFIDGQALTPSSFGETDALTGVWKPKKYAGTYGTNGFFLNFSDNSSTTNLCLDRSGNGNNWTPNNISVTAGATYDSMTDVPTLTSATQANYCVLNPLNRAYSTFTLSDGNLNWTSGTVNQGSFGTIQLPTSGKYYWEVVMTANAGGNPLLGIGGGNIEIGTIGAYYRTNGLKEQYGGVSGNGSSSYGATWTTNDVIGIAYDADTSGGQITFYKNNSSQGVAFTGLTANFPNGLFAGFQNNATGTTTFQSNFGQRPFAYTPPTGFLALNTFNLPEPSIKQGNKHFDATLFTGNASTQSIVNAGVFQPDLVWTKSRSTANGNLLYDSVRGVGKYLTSNATNAEATLSTTLISFNSNGFTLGADDNVQAASASGVGWQWKAGGSAVSNTAGSITSQVSANPTAGFSVVTYTGTGANATVGHGLGVAPKMIIVKNRSQAATWILGHQNMAVSSPWNGFMQLNQTTAYTTASGSLIWNNTAPTSTVFSVGTDTATNFSGNSLVAYCFSEVAGYSKFGSYTGNGSADGTFVYTGFRPRYVMVKNATTGGYDWVLWDSARSTYNVTSNILVANQSSAEATSASFYFDFVSNGFKVRASYAGVNESSSTLIYMAFAENPFKNSLAR